MHTPTRSELIEWIKFGTAIIAAVGHGRGG